MRWPTLEGFGVDRMRRLGKRKIIIESQDKNIRVSLIVELATTEWEWERGLMFRHFLPANEGMLFIFQEDESYGFWMKDTYIPLTAAYADRRGQIVELQDLESLNEYSETPKQPYRYALEVNQGWFESHGLGIGSYIIVDKQEPCNIDISLTHVDCCATCYFWSGWCDCMFCRKHKIEIKPNNICEDHATGKPEPPEVP